MRHEFINGLLIDLSGTIHIDKKEIPGAVEAIRKLRKSGLPFRYAIQRSESDMLNLT
jgi:ribonucleotide monophosphatase NagD (HAD superfamily)